MIRIVQIGLGPVGRQVVRYGLKRKGIRFVGAVDTSPELVGRDLGVLGGGPKTGVRVRDSITAALGRKRADVAIVTTGSSLDAVADTLDEAAAAGLSVVSTCEELVHPFATRPRLARRIDRVFRKAGTACVGTGVNPGFLMDTLPAVLTAVSREVRSVRVSRIQDASLRRIPFQEKIGAGLTRAAFAKRVAAGTLRHVGLTESMHLLAAGLGWQLDRTEETLKAVRARERIDSGYVPIERGRMCGVEQIGRGFLGGREVIRLRFRAAVGEAAPEDRIEIRGTPPMTVVFPGGVHGDVATAAVTLNSVPRIHRAGPGLRTMLDLPAPTCGG